MSKIICYLLIALIIISCDEDNSNEPTVGYDPGLFGSWQLETLRSNGNSINPSDVEDLATKVHFNSDGTGTVWIEDYGTPDETISFNWNTSGNQLTIIEVFVGTYLLSGDACTVSYMDGNENIELVYTRE